VYATTGIHPHNAKYADAEALAAIRTLAQLPHVVAIGEIGLDYHYDFSPRDEQRAALRSQIELAIDLRLPVVFHCREAEDDFAAIVEPMHAALTTGIMHCFGGDAAFAERCLGWGFYVSFAGNVTFPKSHALREALGRVPPDRLLIETDSPYLAPQPVRGKRCEPVHVRYTAEAVAALRGVSPETLAEQTTSNARACFRRDSGLSPNA
jgi:TatD DNase family protein